MGEQTKKEQKKRAQCKANECNEVTTNDVNSINYYSFFFRCEICCCYAPLANISHKTKYWMKIYFVYIIVVFVYFTSARLWFGKYGQPPPTAIRPRVYNSSENSVAYHLQHFWCDKNENDILFIVVSTWWSWDNRQRCILTHIYRKLRQMYPVWCIEIHKSVVHIDRWVQCLKFLSFSFSLSRGIEDFIVLCIYNFRSSLFWFNFISFGSFMGLVFLYIFLFWDTSTYHQCQ